MQKSETILKKEAEEKLEVQNSAKVSSSNKELRLPGAKFKIQKYDVNGNGYGYVDMLDESGNPIICTTNDSGEASFENLEYGKYQLVEVEAPVGYSLLKEPIQVDINKESSEQTIIVENTAVYALPSSGGPGIYWYLMGGTLLMIAASFILYKEKHKPVQEK